MLAASASQASLNIGNALGAFFGGLPLVYGYDYTSPAYVGAAMALIGAFFAFWLIKSNSNKPVTKTTATEEEETEEQFVVMH